MRHELVFEEAPEVFLDVGCSRPPLFDVFDELLALLIPDVIAATDPAVAALSAIERWRELLRASKHRELTSERQIGLFAELWCLRELARDGRITSASQWRGPLHEPHDLHLGDQWLEVKAVGPSTTLITIHGLEQLDLDGDLPGKLAVVELVEDADGESLPQLAASILESGQLLPVAEAEELLLTSGALGAPSDRHWTVTDLLLVDATRCPRLIAGVISGGLPDGLAYVQYEIERSVLDSRGVRGLHALRGSAEAT